MGKLAELPNRGEHEITLGNLALQVQRSESVPNLEKNAGVVVDFATHLTERKKHHKQAKETLSWQSTTREYVNFFNRFYREEELPRDWKNLQYGENQVGFSMKGQMDLLEGDNPESRTTWAKQTRQDLQGFVIEYLSPYIVFPWHHEKEVNSDGTANLVDSRYGRRRMVDTVSENERGGVVKQVIEAIDQAVVNKKVSDKSIFVQWSPMDESPTGLKQDNGDDVVYSDTHLVVSQVDGDQLNGFTVKTDLTQTECREMIRRLTGRVIPIGASVEEYIKAVALIDPSKGRITSIEDVIRQAANVRADLSLGSSKAYKDKPWESVIKQIGQGDKLYDYTNNMQTILKRFEEDVIADNPTREELPEYIAATVLRVSQEALMAKEQANNEKENQGRGITSHRAPSFKKTLIEATLIQGCAGGGKKTAVGGMYGTTRAVSSSSGGGGGGGSSCPEIKCNGCSWTASESEANDVQSGNIKSCPKCGWSPK